MDEVADVVERRRARSGPQRLGDLLGMNDAIPLADQVLEDVAGPLLEPLAAQRALGAVHVHAAEGGDPQARAADPVRIAAPAPVAGIAGTQVQESAAVAQRRCGYPKGADAPTAARVDPDLGEGAVGLSGALGQAALGA